jgi:hypothetical protein
MQDARIDPRETPHVQFSGGTGVEQRLQELPPEWVRAIAVRGALRVLPLVGIGLVNGRFDIGLAAFRASFVAWAACMYPNKEMQAFARDAANAVEKANLNFSSNDVANYTTATAGLAARITAERDDKPTSRFIEFRETAIDSARFAAGSAAEDQFLRSISEDVDWLARRHEGENTKSPELALMAEPIWLIEVCENRDYLANFPLWAREAFDAFADKSLGRDGNWRLWASWYRAILPDTMPGQVTSAFGEEADISIATQPPEFWTRMPDDVMADIDRVVRGLTPGFVSPPDSGTIDGEEKTGETRSVFLSDVPAPGDDHLGRTRQAFVLAARLNRIWDDIKERWAVESPSQRNRIQPGFVIHVDAPWGGGKTSFAGFLTQILNPYRQVGNVPEWLQSLPLRDEKFWPAAYRRAWHVVNYNAWQRQHVKPPWWVFYDAIRRECMSAMASELNHQGDLPKPDDLFYGRSIFTRRCRWLLSSIGEQCWRLWTPEFKIKLFLTALMIGLVVLLSVMGVIQFGIKGYQIVPNNLADGTHKGVDQYFQSLWLAPVALLFAGASTAWTVLSAFTQTLFSGTPEAARNYSLGSGDPHDRFRVHFVKMTKKVRASDHCCR